MSYLTSDTFSSFCFDEGLIGCKYFHVIAGHKGQITFRDGGKKDRYWSLA